MIKILFLIHDLGQGGAEKVLVNLVNNMDPTKFDISVTALFGGGVNEQFLKPHIHFQALWPKMFPGNSHLMKLLTPKQLHRLCVKGRYDIEVSYLEGPSARVISGCEDSSVKLVSWIHIEQKTKKRVCASFRSYREAVDCYERFNRLVCVSDTVRQDFLGLINSNRPIDVLYNTNESGKIVELAKDENLEESFCSNEIKVIGVGKIIPSKGFDRISRIHKRLRDDGYPIHTYALGAGSQQEEIEKFLQVNGLTDSYTFLGYQTNPYKYVAKCDLFVCASFAEGFSTAATEALIVGTPVCTTEVSGMREMLGDNEYGIITENDEEALYEGIKNLLDHPEKLAYYKEKAIERGKRFSTEETVKAVEEMLLKLAGESYEHKSNP